MPLGTLERIPRATEIWERTFTRGKREQGYSEAQAAATAWKAVKMAGYWQDAKGVWRSKDYKPKSAADRRAHRRALGFSVFNPHPKGKKATFARKPPPMKQWERRELDNGQLLRVLEVDAGEYQAWADMGRPARDRWDTVTLVFAPKGRGRRKELGQVEDDQVEEVVGYHQLTGSAPPGRLRRALGTLTSALRGAVRGKQPSTYLVFEDLGDLEVARGEIEAMVMRNKPRVRVDHEDRVLQLVNRPKTDPAVRTIVRKLQQLEGPPIAIHNPHPPTKGQSGTVMEKEAHAYTKDGRLVRVSDKSYRILNEVAKGHVSGRDRPKGVTLDNLKRLEGYGWIGRWSAKGGGGFGILGLGDKARTAWIDANMRPHDKPLSKVARDRLKKLLGDLEDDLGSHDEAVTAIRGLFTHYTEEGGPIVGQLMAEAELVPEETHGERRSRILEWIKKHNPHGPVRKGKRIRIDRKGYTYKRDGKTIRVPPTTFFIDDPGRPGRADKPPKKKTKKRSSKRRSKKRVLSSAEQRKALENYINGR